MSQKKISDGTSVVIPSNVSNDEEVIPTTAESASIEIENVEQKKRKLTSEVWNHFTREKIGGQGKITATCHNCKKKFDGQSSKGTTHLKNHIRVCPLRGQSDIRQAYIGKSVSSTTSDDHIPKMSVQKFDPMTERTLFAKMVAKHDLPFLMSQYEYFRLWISYCMPSYKHRSRNTVKNDLVTVYNEEKAKVYEEIENLTSRVTLTTDGWTSDHQNRGYFCLTLHYVDSDWRLQKKLIAFHCVQYPHDGLNMCEWLKSRLLEWNIDKKIFSVVVDNASSNSGMLEGVKKWLNDKESLIHNGDMFHLRCSAHILNLIVKNGFEVIRGLIVKIRDSVKYINQSPQRDEKFSLALTQTRLSSKRRVSLDCETRWNATYDMLVSAIDLREAFIRLADLDIGYTFLPTKEEWEIGVKVRDHLKIFKDATMGLSGSKYPTAPLYFTFVCQIREKLMKWSTGSDEKIKEMAQLMEKKFDKYWEECNMVLTIAAVLDPRYKMTIVRAAFRSMYGDFAYVYVEKVRNFWDNLLSEYQMTDQFSDLHGSSSSPCEPFFESSESNSSFLTFFKELAAESDASEVKKKSEIDMYLEEGLVKYDEKLNGVFDILSWWKHNGSRFPSLAMMARDILAIPCTSVPSESTFSQARRIIDDTRASLLSETVEALLCTKDWLPSSNERDDESIILD